MIGRVQNLPHGENYAVYNPLRKNTKVNESERTWTNVKSPCHRYRVVPWTQKWTNLTSHVLCSPNERIWRHMYSVLSTAKTTCGDTMWKSLNWVVISSEKNWKLQLHVSISMLWSSSGDQSILIAEHTNPSILIETSSCNLRFFSELITTQLRDFHTVSPQALLYLSSSPCKATSFTYSVLLLTSCIRLYVP